MISTHFAPPAPEAFTAKPARQATEPGRESSNVTEFAEALRKQSPAPRESDANQAPVSIESAPSDAQNVTDAAQQSDDADIAPESEVEIDSEAAKPESAVDASIETTVPIENQPRTPVTVHPSASSSENDSLQPEPRPNSAAHLDKAVESTSTGATPPLTEADAAPANEAQGKAPGPNPSVHPELNVPAPASEGEAAANPETTAAAASAHVAPPPRSSSSAVKHEQSSETPEVAPATEKPVETTAATRLQPIEASQSAADINLRPSENRSFVDMMQRAEASTPQSPTPDTSAENKLFTAQVSRGLEAALRQNGGSVTIRLKPEALGALRIDLQVQQGSIAAQFEASTAEARELLNKNLATLRTALEAKGFGVRSVDVQVASSSQSGHANNEFGRSMGEGHAQPRDAGANGHGQSSSRREDPGGFSLDQRSGDTLAEDERVGPKWRSVYVGGSLNTVA